MKKIILAILAVLVLSFAVTSSAQAYVGIGEAQNKAAQNSWNGICHSTYNYCNAYPGIYRASQRVDGYRVDTFISVPTRQYGWCYRRIRVTDDGGGPLRVMEGQSGYWSCPY